MLSADVRSAALACLEAFSGSLKAHDTKLQRDAAAAAAATGGTGVAAGSGGVATNSSGMLGWAMSSLAASSAALMKGQPGAAGTGSGPAAAAAGAALAAASPQRVSSSSSSHVGPVTPAAGGAGAGAGLGSSSLRGSGGGGGGGGGVGAAAAAAAGNDGWDEDFDDGDDAAELEVSGFFSAFWVKSHVQVPSQACSVADNYLLGRKHTGCRRCECMFRTA